MSFLGPPINTIELLCLPEVELGWAKQNSLGSWEEAPSGKELVAVVADESFWIQRSPVPGGAVEGWGGERTSPVLVLKDIPILQA